LILIEGLITQQHDEGFSKPAIAFRNPRRNSRHMAVAAMLGSLRFSLPEIKTDHNA
jgi:hypothetical protein